MRILWLSNAPWSKTGYGRMTALFVPRLIEAGHQVAIAAFQGLHGGPLEWQGIPVYPGGAVHGAMDVVAGHYAHWRADLLITLADTWTLDPAVLARMNTACWTPVDCEPLGVPDQEVLRASGAVPVAVSRHGEAMMRAAGLDPLYVPHGVDAAVFRPPAARPESRLFTVGMNAANQDKRRKGFDEAFQAFARFRRRHEARLLVHTAWQNDQRAGADGLDLQVLADARGIHDDVAFCDQYAYRAGLTGDDGIAEFYGQLDVLLNPSLGEGFGLPVLEAQACGVPVIVTRASAMTELCGAGWQAGGQKTWAWLHQADWTTPSVSDLADRLHKACQRARWDSMRGQAREFALAYDVRRVTQDYWVPALEALGRQSQ